MDDRLTNPPAIHQPADCETERELIDTARDALSRCSWTIGECATKWTQRHARGRTDADFGNLINLSGEQVRQRRVVWETFADVRSSYLNLKFTHFVIALNWDDAPECLAWADENQATVAEMKAWRRMQHGADLTVDDDAEADMAEHWETPAEDSGAADAEPEPKPSTTRQRETPTTKPKGRDASPKTEKPKRSGEKPYTPHGKSKKHQRSDQTPGGFNVDDFLTRLESLLGSWSTTTIAADDRPSSAVVLRRVAADLIRKADELDPDGKAKATGKQRTFLPTDEEQLYQAYPRQVGRGQAIKAIRTALKKTDFETLMAAVTEFAECQSDQEPHLIPHASTWFNGERWLDDRDEWKSHRYTVSGSRGSGQRRSDPARVRGTATTPQPATVWDGGDLA